jgi:ADP-heptose:LPS heptosyltransferase
MNIVSAVRQIQNFRRWVAPPESAIEKWLRRVYVPFFQIMPARWRVRVLHDQPKIPLPTYLAYPGVAHQTYQDAEQFQRQPIHRILLLKLDHLGDFIVSLRAMRLIRVSFPAAHITLVCASWNRPWAQQLGWFDRIVVFNFFSAMNKDWSVTERDLMARYDAVTSLPLDSYDLAVDLRHDVDTRPCLYRIVAAHRAGFHAPAHAGLPSLDLALPMMEGALPNNDSTKPLQAELRLQVLASAVVAAFAVPDPHPANALLTTPSNLPTHPFAILAIGAGDPIRCWPIERYGDVGRELIARNNLDIVVLGGPSDQADADRLAALLPYERVRTVIGAPLAELPNLVARAALCVCNGSGISHLAAALDVPTVCVLSGASRMHVWHPAGANVVSIGGMTPCQPCGLKRPSDCPWDVACLMVVSTTHVLSVCEQLLTPRVPAVTAETLPA